MDSGCAIIKLAVMDPIAATPIMPDAGILPPLHIAPPMVGRPASLPLLLAASVGSGVAHLGTSTMPFQVGALMEGLGLSASAAGVFGFFEIGALALTMLLVSPVIHRYRAALVAAAGAALGIVGHLGLYFVGGGVGLLWMLGLVAGVGYGLVFAATVAGVAACRNVDRVYAIANGGALVVITALMAALPMVSVRFGALGPFLGVAVLLAITLPAFAGFRQSGGALAVTGATPFRKQGVAALLLVWTFFSLGTGALWSFAERIGNSLGLSHETVALVLSASTFCGIAGTAVAGMMAGRIGRLKALAFGLAGCGCACLLMGFASNIFAFAVAVLFYWLFYMFLYSYLLGSAASLDPTGRIGTAGGGCERMGFALGAPIGGVLADHFGFAAVGALGGLACIGVLPFALPALARAFSPERAVRVP